MHDESASAADHEITGISHDPAALADYFQARQEQMTHDDAIQGSRMTFDEQRDVLIVETADKIHGFQYTPDQFANAVTRNGNPRHLLR
jgi:hypothetical protein